MNKISNKKRNSDAEQVKIKRKGGQVMKGYTTFLLVVMVATVATTTVKTTMKADDEDNNARK